ncbi:FeoB-associated Cys-rich membrane protein [Olsenella sp. YH-ols2217]|uniref:FeoB-associated Cys-rich membrane protein n=1 Tax=Kribbibacterium absianum TaxID=3044210 RepID=A0ABT6ZL19_9ACTN|nr:MULTISPECIES: FeoB-associated Cys-rich membrane protein [unclassified Olsenella]MDJ1121727.1 FeoB-associated Cys-rich membrane protein [Olsenella sp. YH-ols2216]MDJ1129735.1 FeoB-associated Cys-rich membrane protein [Olsenella sp. YH-ols2217]
MVKREAVDSMIDFIIVLLVAAAVIAVVARQVRRQRNGGGCAGCDVRGCSGHETGECPAASMTVDSVERAARGCCKPKITAAGRGGGCCH